MNRTPFPRVFWVANTIEVLERFAYYGIYFGFGIYMEHLGYTKGQLGIVQSVFLFISYAIPVISGTFADKYGFKKVLIVSYLAYLPSILLLIITKSFSGIALTMLSIGLAAGIFKPLISGTVRTVTDKTNKTLGFGIFYAMVNVGGSFGPIVAGKLRAISWDYAFYAAAISIGLMLFITIFFYKEPEREIEGITLKQKFKDILSALSDVKFAIFLVLLGLFFWLPFWAFFNLLALYVDKNLDTAKLYLDLKSVFGTGFANFFSQVDEAGTRKILGETISHTGYIIMILQIFVSRIFEKFRAIPSFLFGLVVAAVGYCFLGYSMISSPSWVFLGILLFAVGEMISSPRIQEYITWIAPKEKAGLYMGSNFLAIGIGGLVSGLYTFIYGQFRNMNHPEYVWFVLAAHLIVGIIAISIFTRTLGEFKELEE
ncbi:MAG: MFS transporter [Candidatus Aminicenantes bacterium]|nr:MFS transporter [Candidatus Aminicenantes bacterium]NIM80394.1 MFS transporter [Candidatus Aminicenantes bacterium]NIN19781.1 MFS transporter [Candidatus Aminicenantes bacterium]NIN43663.1 MFS transporter [Candidatus Aminicenantes bacterium]NIN86408.1 MFS transporter [Candidatus Aminicenantes bacterium]